jgi:exonuclease VII large subunit
VQIERIRSELVMMRAALGNAAHASLAAQQAEIGQLRERAARDWHEGFRGRSWTTALRATALSSLNPHSVLSRGFALVEDAQSGRVLRSVHDTAPGDLARISMSDGYLLSEVREQVPAQMIPESSAS